MIDPNDLYRDLIDEGLSAPEAAKMVKLALSQAIRDEISPPVYHVFAGDCYYPFGGMSDYKGTAASLQEAIDLLPEDEEWAQIATVKENGTLETVEEYSRHPSYSRKDGTPGPWILREHFDIQNPEQTP